MKLPDHVRAFFEAHDLRGRGIAGVSGGLDSVAMVHLLLEAGLEIELAHVNYRLRGAESEEDQRLVQALAEGLSLPLHAHEVEPASIPMSSRQAWAREVRYGEFHRVAMLRGAQWVAVAHHADDQAETVLLSLLRGTGVAGLGGMRPVRRLREMSDVRLVRPLLDVPRAALLEYAQQYGLRWREDASNADPRYRRAWLRTRLMPLLRERFGDDVAERIARTAALAREQFVAPWQAEREAAQAEAFTSDGVRLDVLRALGERARGRLLLDALERFLPSAPRTASVAAQLGALVEAQVGRHVRFGAGTVWREREELRFVPAEAARASESRVLHPGGRIETALGWIEASPIGPPGDPHVPPEVCWLDADAVVWPLTVRRWQASDRMQPLGMTGRKKVSDLLTDARWPTSERHHALVVCSGDDIVWVRGVRVSEVGRIRPETRRAVRLQYRRGVENV